VILSVITSPQGRSNLVVWEIVREHLSPDLVGGRRRLGTPRLTE